MNLASLAESASSLMHRALLSWSDQPLIVLRVGLIFPEGEPEVTIDLKPFSKAAQATDTRTWRVTCSALGAPTTLSQETEPRLELPLQVADGLKASLAAMDVASDQPLWLDLIRPYGYLGIAPWERVLGHALGRPVLRLPDVLLPPGENPDVLEVAVIFDPPSTTPAEMAVWQVKSIADGILRSSSRLQTRVNVFAAATWIDRLRLETFDKRVWMHEPAKSPTVADSSPGKGSSPEFSFLATPWTNWISSALNGRSVDAVQFLCAAEATDTGAVLALSSPPCPASRPLPQIFASIEDISAVLTRLGAWAAMFSPPHDGSASDAMAFVADALAHCRPGPILYHRLATPQDSFALVEAYGTLFSSSRSRAARLTDGFVYCLPGSVAGQATIRIEPIVEAVVQNAQLIAARAPLAERLLTTVTNAVPGVTAHVLEQAPNWAVAVQRYVESAALDQMRRVSGDVLLSRAAHAIERVASAASASDTAIVKETLADIQNAVLQYLQKTDKS